MPQASIQCSAWRSRAMPDTYLLVDQAEGLARVPHALLQRFTQAELVTSFSLHSERSLARADAAAVMQQIREQGYYLQMPPARDRDMGAVAARNDKLTR